MAKIVARMMTTHIDSQGEKFTLGALESVKRQIEKYIIPQGIEHDPRIAPVGRILSAEIINLEDGEYALDAISEIFTDTENLEEITGRELRIHEYTPDSFEIRSDRSHRNDIDRQLISDISKILNCKNPPQEEGKKSVEPLSILWICGAFALSGFLSGFLNKIGSDAFDLLKCKLSALFDHGKGEGKEKLLAFEITISDKNCNVEVILTNPSAEDINAVMTEGFAHLDKILPFYLDIPTQKPIKKLVFELEDGMLKLKFGVRNDGIPFNIDWEIKSNDPGSDLKSE